MEKVHFVGLYCAIIAQCTVQKTQNLLTDLDFRYFLAILFNDIFNVLKPAGGKAMANYPLGTCPGCSLPEPYRSPDYALVPVQTSSRAEYYNNNNNNNNNNNKAYWSRDAPPV